MLSLKYRVRLFNSLPDKERRDMICRHKCPLITSFVAQSISYDIVLLNDIYVMLSYTSWGKYLATEALYTTESYRPLMSIIDITQLVN